MTGSADARLVFVVAALSACGTPPPHDVGPGDADAAVDASSPHGPGDGHATDGGPPATPAGILDSTFGNGGCVSIALDGDRRNESRPWGIALDRTSDVTYLGGTTNTNTLQGRGWMATIAGNGGVAANTSVLATSWLYMATLPPGASAPTFVAAARSGVQGNVVIRTDASGAADPAFAIDPVLSSTYFAAERYQATGNLVLLGGPFSGNDRLVRVDATGAVDPTFGAHGSLTLQTSAALQSQGYATSFAGTDLAIDAADAIYVAGTISPTDSASADAWAVARYHADGTLDASFGDHGFVVAGPQPRSANPGFVLATSPSVDHLYLIGKYDDASSAYRAAWVVHVTASGLDTSFGGGGHVTLTQPNQDLNAIAAAVQSDGAVVIGINGSSKWYVTRLATTGAVDTSYANQGWLVGARNLPDGGTGTTDAPIQALALAKDGGVVVVQNWQFVHNLYAEAQAIVCKLTP